MSEENNYTIFNTLNMCRLIFYTPIVFLGSLLVSITYDYITYKDEENNKKSD
jgi:hypothetical protein